MGINVTPDFPNAGNLIKKSGRHLYLVLPVISLLFSSATAQLPSSMITPGFYNFTLPYNGFQDRCTNGIVGGDATCVSNGSLSDYIDGQNVVETMFNTGGQCITIGFQLNSLLICANDSLIIYDGPSVASPALAKYTNMVAPANPALLTTTPYVTFKFLSDNTNSHARGWAINFTVGTCPSTPPNDDCSGAIPLNAAVSCLPTSGSTFGAHQSSQPAGCTGATTINDDVWYRFVANNSNMSVTVNGSNNMDPVVQVFSGACGSLTSIACQNAVSGINTSETLNLTSLVAGITYYIRLYDVNTGVGQNLVNYTYNICVVGSAPQDCPGAFPICSTTAYDGTFIWNSYGLQEYSPGSFGCITGGETTSEWFFWQCQTAGTLGFNIASSNGTFQDVDWALWGNMSSMSCPMTAPPIRCSYAQGFPFNSYGLPAFSTGLQAAETDVSEGAGTCGGLCNAFVDTVHMKAGKYYALLMNLWGGNLNYEITFNLTDGATFNNCVLPIELASFEGENLGAVNWIYWTTESEVNNDHFVLQHSSDGFNFSDLAIIKASGNSSVEDKYDYYDQRPFAGINYYRLKQVDVDESYSYSEIISIGKFPGGDMVTSVFPNPTTGVINVALMGENDCSVVIEVYNEVGQLIQTSRQEMHRGENNFPVDLKAFNRGIYTLKISACDVGKIFTKKIAKI